MRKKLPQLREHKVRGRRYGYATFNGTEVRYGRIDSSEDRTRAEAEFATDLAQWLQNGRQFPEEDAGDGPTVRELVDRYRAHLEAEHDAAWHTNNDYRVDGALDPLCELYGAVAADEFGPRTLKTVREAMLSSGRPCASTLNARVSRIKDVFRFGVEEQLVPAETWHALAAVKNLRGGAHGVRGSTKRQPVDEVTFRATLEHLAPVPRAICELLWHSGARVGELLDLRPCDVDRYGPVWLYRPQQHKTEHHGCDRVIALGPKAQDVLRRFLDRVPRPDTEEPLFSPRAALAEHRGEQRSHRETPLWPSHVARYEREREQRRREGRQEQIGDRYTAGVLRRAVERAVTRANRERRRSGETPLPRWVPGQLRHSCATRLRRELGIDGARAVLGHTSAATTEIYAEVDRQKAIAAMATLG